MIKYLEFIFLCATVHHSLAVIQYTDAEWIHNVTKRGESVTLNCSAALKNSGGSTSTAESWLLNRYQQANMNYDDGNVKVMDQGWTLHIKSVQWHHLGYYSCISENSTTDIWSLKFALNPIGNDFEDLWSKFEWNTIIGLSATAVFVGLIALIFIVYYFRWQPDEKWLHKNEEATSKHYMTETGQPVRGVNAAYELDSEPMSEVKTQPKEHENRNSTGFVDITSL